MMFLSEFYSTVSSRVIFDGDKKLGKKKHTQFFQTKRLDETLTKVLIHFADQSFF